MGDDYVVYTTDINGGQVIGYRNGDTWYDAQGNEVSDPNALAGVTGKLTPYLKIHKITKVDNLFHQMLSKTIKPK
jgi:hypothetical protein